jgi:hypothetical protein
MSAQVPRRGAEAQLSRVIWETSVQEMTKRMGQESEAECLLRSGKMYTKRLGLRARSREQEAVFAGFKHGAFSLYFGDAPIYHFDLEGRWQRAFMEGTHYLKSLDTGVAAIDRVREGANLVLRRRTVGFGEASDIDETIRSAALGLASDLLSGRVESIDPPSPARPIARAELLEFLERVGRWDAASWFSQRESYLGSYGPLGFLPPEGLQDAILQATLGHAGGIAFGNSPPAEHYIRSTAEFEDHAQAVSKLLGRRILQCRGVYLGGSDVLRQPEETVASYLETTARVFPLEAGDGPSRLSEKDDESSRLTGVDAFLDDFRPPLPDRRAWTRFRELRLRRVVLGIESGDREIRHLYGKRWEDDAFRTTVEDLKSAGLEVGIVVLVGAGGRENEAKHVAATARLLNDSALDAGDLVYLLAANEVGGEVARQKLEEQGVSALAEAASPAQQQSLLDGLSPLRTRRKVKVVPYSLTKQMI